MKIEDILILGGVAIAGYMIMRGTGGTGGGTSPVRYITNIPQALSPVEKPVVKEPDSTPMIINLPSESITFPAPKLPSPTSLLPQIPFKNFEEPETQVVSAVTKKPTPTPTKKSESIKPSRETWAEYTLEKYGLRPGESRGGETILRFEQLPAYPESYLRWLESKKEKKISETVPPTWNPKATFYEQISGGLTTTKKEQKVIPEKASESKVKPLFYQSMWYKKPESKTKSVKPTTKKESKEKKPPALPGITWKKSGSGWIPVRS